MFAQILVRCRVVLRNWLRVDAAKKWIVLRIQRCHATSGSCEQLLETTGANSEQGIVGKLQFRLRDQFKIYKGLNRSEMFRSHVHYLGRMTIVLAECCRLHR